MNAIADKYDAAIREALTMGVNTGGYSKFMLEQIAAASIKALADHYWSTYGKEAGQLSRTLTLEIRGEKWKYALLKHGDTKARVFRIRASEYTTDKELFLNGEEQ